MSYQVTFKVKIEFLEAHVNGNRKVESSAEDSLRAISTIARRCKLEGMQRIMIFWHIEGKMDKGQALVLISNLERYNWDRSFKFASVHPILSNYKSNTFTEKVAKNLGWNVRFFHKEENALEWILKD